MAAFSDKSAADAGGFQPGGCAAARGPLKPFGTGRGPGFRIWLGIQCYDRIRATIEVFVAEPKGSSMKQALSIMLVCLLAQCAWAKKPRHSKTNAPPDATATAPAATPAVDPATQVKEYQKQFVPTDPWRIMNDKTNFAKGSDWCQFEGRVVQVFPSGIELRGWFGEPLLYMLQNNLPNDLFFLSNYPRPVTAGQVLSRNDRLVALKAGTTPAGNLPNLDYGTVWSPNLPMNKKPKPPRLKTMQAQRSSLFTRNWQTKAILTANIKWACII